MCTLPAAAAIAVSVLAWFLVLVGLGALPLLRRRRLEGAPSVLECYWIGLGLFVSWLIVSHLVFPANGWDVLPAVIAGAGGAVALTVRGHTSISAAARVLLRSPWRLVASVVLLGLLALAADLAIGVSDAYDAGLYYLQSISWDHTYPVVTG